MGKHLAGIDGLRAVAVLSVVAYHAGLPLDAGFVGVDIFFVISGFVITRMLAAEHANTGRIDLAAFYARRARRILPALITLVAVTLAASTALLAPTYRIAVFRSAISAMGMVANFHFQAVTGGYFDASADQMPLLHLWSLAVEEQFYLVWPLLLLLRGRKGALMLLGCASFVLAHTWASGPRPELAFYQMPARFWELAVGGLIAIAPGRGGRVAGYAGLLLLAISIYWPLPDFPGTGALPVVIGTGLVISAIHGGASFPLLEWKPVRWVGLISYSLYLWHWPLLALSRAYNLDPPPLRDNLLMCGVAVILAALSYHYIETPLRKRNASSLRVIGAGVVACVLLAGCAAAARTLTPLDTLADKINQDFPHLAHECHAQSADVPRLPPVSCGDGDVVLWGDSHAYAWRPYAEKLGSVYQMTRAACPPSTGGTKNWCAQYDTLAMQRAKRAKIVVLAASWLRYRKLGQPAEADLSRVLDNLSSAKRVIVMGPLPYLPYTPEQCADKERIDLCVMSRAQFESEARAPRQALIAAVAKHPNAEYVEPVNFFCNATTCPMMRDGYSLFWDDDHISASAARNFH